VSAPLQDSKNILMNSPWEVLRQNTEWMRFRKAPISARLIQTQLNKQSKDEWTATTFVIFIVVKIFETIFEQLSPLHYLGNGGKYWLVH
jgi:hypothetical protein